MPWKMVFLIEYDTKKEALFEEKKINKYDILWLKKNSLKHV